MKIRISKKSIKTLMLVGAALILLIGTGFIYVNYPRVKEIDSETNRFPDGIRVSTWIWQPPTKWSQTAAAELLDFCVNQGINTVYLSLDEYADLFEQEDKAKMEADLSNFEEHLSGFVALATERGVEVEALAGNTLWGNSSHHYIPLALIDYVLEYNQRNDNKLKGIQFDIEFYNQEGFADNREDYTMEYLDLVREMAGRMSVEREQIRLGLAVPYWFDHEKGVVPALTWRNNRNTVFVHVCETLKPLPDTYMVIMAYRNRVNGYNGTIAITKMEVDYLSRMGDGPKVIVGQETGQVKPVGITYYGKNKSDVRSSASMIANYYKDKRAFAGIAVHDLVSYRKLK